MNEIKEHSNEEIKGTIVHNNILVVFKKYYLNSFLIILSEKQILQSDST